MGAVLGALKEVGVEEDFMRDLAKNLKPGSSVLFAVVRKGKPESIIEAMRPFEGRILRTSLSHQNETELRQALEKADYNKTLAAKLLNISYDSLRYQVKKYGLE